MPLLPPLVLADDLTGAAEIAAIAHQAGLRAVVLTAPPARTVTADVLVLDTETRLVSAAEAARRMRTLAERLHRVPHAGVFLKVDSVLRGPVLAQVTAVAEALGRRRVLLVPANPSLGRTLRDGRYFVDGRPLHQTAFGRDPHHPRTSDLVFELLGPARHPPVVCPPRATRLPRTGVVVGETATAADVTRWAGRLDASTLPAGAADFFRAWLRNQKLRRRAAPQPALPEGGVVLLHGTTSVSPVRRALLFKGVRAPSIRSVRAALARDGAAAVAASPATLGNPDAPEAITTGFAALAQDLHRTRAFNHLLIAGGATAAAVLRALGWPTLEVVRVWGPGVVTLRPVADPGFAVTLKPGSYSWPATLRRALHPFRIS
ncbi:MAG TPA: four-carbon acid sugar kinase family protein [Lacunisphaera sp.]|nr:four-carbon acid sugar kinase family protein [Lacunisphaera sp.]